MEASQFAPLAATTKNTILRFESGQFMPRPATVGEIDRVLRQRGIFPIYTKEGEPRGIVIGWEAYQYAYPGYEVHHKTVEEIAAHQRAMARHGDREVAEALSKQRDVAGTTQTVAGVAEQPRGARGIDELEAEQRRLMAELEQLRQEVDLLDDEHDF